ncbi:MAG TPA: universal stress protein [Thermodesulfobacteriaceae bacterium]|nr:universal stress protein [Thermodesulfobacteriaceae bacterium]
MKFVAAVDFSEISSDILRHAERLARSTSGELFLLHCTEPDPYFVGYGAGPDSVRHQVARKFREERRRLQAEADRIRRTGLKVTALVIQGTAVETILDEVERLHADMIIIGSHGHGAVYDILVGSVGEGILKKSPVPVLVVPGHRK